MTTPTDADLNTYIKVALVEAQAEVCARNDDSFAASFAQLFQAWQQANAQSIAAGSAIAKERQIDGSGPTSIKGFARMNAAILEGIPADDRRRRCAELLQFFLAQQPK